MNTLLDRCRERLLAALVSEPEQELLRTDCWDFGQDVRLREDSRFRPTPWKRWILSEQYLANNFVRETLRASGPPERPVDELLADLAATVGRPCILCPGDPRLVVQKGLVRLAASELSQQPFVEDAGPLEKYKTHLPLHRLQAAAASLPAGEWGRQKQEQIVETLGWVRVDLPGQRLNDRMFVAQIVGQSMNDGRSGLTDGGYAVFEFWPRGTRQNQIVLVRGAFTDPETGSFAVKKYVADQRDAEGRHQSIRLVSLNPDKERFPDIELAPESDDDLAVVASLVQALLPDAYQRRPRKQTRPGRRDLVSHEGRQRIADRLARAVRRLFEGSQAAEDQDAEEPPAEPPAPARLVCLDMERGGLHVETDPLAELPGFAKKLVVATGNWNATVLGSNLRHRVYRVPVPPSPDAYVWSALGFEEELAQELAPLTVPGLPIDRVTVFRVDAAGVGQLVAGANLTPGQHYRLLVPPTLASLLPADATVSPHDSGWRLWDLIVSMESTWDLREVLDKLGLVLDTAGPVARWSVVSPVAYVRAARGDNLPVFNGEPPPLLDIGGLETHFDGDLTVFVASTEQYSALPLPAGDSWHVALRSLPPGHYVVDVLAKRTAVAPVRLAFAINPGIPEPVPADLIVQWQGEGMAWNKLGRLVIDHDGSAWQIGAEELKIAGPPLWPCRVTRETTDRQTLEPMFLSDNGTLDGDELANRNQEFWQRSVLGNLQLDCSELGLLELRHTRRATPEQLQAVLAGWLAEKIQLVTTLKGQFPLLRSMWLDPLLDRFGYERSEIAPDVLEGAPMGTTALLLSDSRRREGRIERHRCAVLLLTTPETDWRSFTAETARAFADLLCQQFEVDEGILTDGLRWTRHRCGKHVHGRTWDLQTMTRPEAMEDFEQFLFEFAAGV